MFRLSTLRLLTVLALVAAVALVYAPVRAFDYVNFDDPLYVTDEPHMRDGLTWASVAWALTGPHAKLWHPLTTLSHLFDVHLFGLEPGAHHVMNAGLHALAGVLAFVALDVLTGAHVASGLAALLLALHPLRVESVAWVSERKDVLSMACAALTLVTYAGWTRRPSAPRYAAFLLVATSGILAKATLVVLPGLLLLLDYWPLGRLRPGMGCRAAWFLLREKLPLLIVAGVASVLTYQAQAAGGAVVGLDVVPVGHRVANALVSVQRYLMMTAWPRNLAVLYPWRPVSAADILQAAAGIAAVTATAIRTRRVAPWLLVGWLWFLVALFPVSGLVQAGGQALADRFTYLPHLGLLTAVVWGVRGACGGRRLLEAAATITAVAVAIAYALASARQVHVWRDSTTLFAHALTVTQDNYRAHTNLGEALARRKQFAEAQRHYESAVRIAPHDVVGRVNLGNALARAGRHDEARTHYEAAVAVDPASPEGLNGLATEHARVGALGDAIALWERAIAAKPHHPESQANLADALARSGRPAEAIPHYEAALIHRPEWADAQYNLANALLAIGRPEDAATRYTAALRRLPEWWEVYELRGVALAAAGHLPEAVRSWEAALRGDPGLVRTRRALAWVRATANDPTLYDPAAAHRLVAPLRADVDTPDALDTVAAADAAAGYYPQAVATARRAGERARALGDALLAEAIRSRIALYAVGRPYRTADPAQALLR